MHIATTPLRTFPLRAQGAGRLLIHKTATPIIPKAPPLRTLGAVYITMRLWDPMPLSTATAPLRALSVVYLTKPLYPCTRRGLDRNAPSGFWFYQKRHYTTTIFTATQQGFGSTKKRSHYARKARFKLPRVHRHYAQRATRNASNGAAYGNATQAT